MLTANVTNNFIKRVFYVLPQKNWQSDFEELFKLLIVFEQLWLENNVCEAAVQVFNYSLSPSVIKQLIFDSFQIP